MIRFTALFSILALTSADAMAQRSILASPGFSEYRPLGDVRGWTYVAKDSAVGQLISTVKQEIEIDGIEGYEISQILQFDYTKIGQDRKQRIRSSHFVSGSGAYLGDKMIIDINEETEELELELNGDNLEGFYTRGDNKIESKLSHVSGRLAADILFLDQFENFLAMRDLKVGDTIFDTVFVPQTMLVEQVIGFVEHFGLVTLYNQVRDSVFIIKITQPQVMIFYFSPRKQLVKAEFLAQQMKAYLDIVRRVAPESLARPSFGVKRIIELLPNYGTYLLFGILSLVFIAGTRIRNPHLYFYLLAGAVGFVAATFTQIPFQSFITEKYFLPKANSGQSPLLLAVVPALTAGVLQEALKLGIVLGIRKYAKTQGAGLLLFGAAAGAGFGIAEAAYVVSQLPTSPVWSINLVERGFLILFHASTGVLLASMLLKDSVSSKLFLLSVAILGNSFLRYLPVFAQSGTDAQLLYIIFPVVPVILLSYSVYLLKSVQMAPPRRQK